MYDITNQMSVMNGAKSAIQNMQEMQRHQYIVYIVLYKFVFILLK